MTTVLAYPVAVHPGPTRSARIPGGRDRLRLTRLGVQCHEVFLGRGTFAIARTLAESEKNCREHLATLQLRKLQRLLDHAATNCPYYRRGLPMAGFLHRLQDLNNVALLGRKDVRRYAREMCWATMPGRRLLGHTHGTSDEPLEFFWDRRRQAWDKANRLRGHRWHGLGPGHRELHVWPVDPPLSRSARLKQRLRECRDRWLGELQIDSLRAFDEHLPLFWQAWRRFDPARVTAYPSVLAQLIRKARAVGCRIGNPSLRRVFLTGEVTFPWQQQLIERELGVPTVQDYGVQEIGPLAYSCPSGAWHLCAESVLIEIIRRGRPARPGEYGEIVVTGLESLAMPMLRYCTGDIVKAPERWDAAGRSPCPCGVSLPVLPPVLGRAADFLESSDGRWIEPAEVLRAMSQVLKHDSFQLVQAADGSVVVRVVNAEAQARRWQSSLDGAIVNGQSQPGGRRAAWDKAINEEVSRLLGPGASCVIKRVPALFRSLYGKCRYVASDRTAGGLAC